MIDTQAIAAEIRELADSWEDPPWLGGPASEASVRQMESELNVRLPKSFRAFLQHFSGGVLLGWEIYGLPIEAGLSLVKQNRYKNRTMPENFVEFTNDGGDYTYWLDVSQMNAENECPVVVWGPGAEGITVADSFLDFLRKAHRNEDLF